MVEKTALDSDGNPKKRPYLETVPALTNGELTPGRHHRADKQRVKWHITPGFIICWVAILILQGAHFGSDKKLLRKMWQVLPMALACPMFKTQCSAMHLSSCGGTFIFLKITNGQSNLLIIIIRCSK